MESQNQAAVEGTTTFFRTCINGINALSGVGILSIPFALSQGGWLSLILLFLVSTISWYTALLLQRCMNPNPHVKTYPDIGALAFGNKGKLMVSIFVYLELYLVAVEFLILEGDNLDKLFPRQGFKIGSIKVEGKQMYMVLTALIILPTTWLRNLGLIAYVSFGGVLASVVLVLCVAWVGAFDGVGFNQIDDDHDLFKLQGLPTTLSLFAFCFCGHPVFPMLSTSMKDQSQFSKVLLVSFVASTMSYSSMGILGYSMYGENTKSQVTLNLPVHKMSTKIAIYTALINPLAKYAAITNPIAIAIEDAYPNLCTNLKMMKMVKIMMRTLLLISTLIVALSIPFFAYVMAFTGAFLSVTTSILIPCSCYLKINRVARKFGWELMVILGILVLGVSILLLGTYTSIKEIVKRS